MVCVNSVLNSVQLLLTQSVGTPSAVRTVALLLIGGLNCLPAGLPRINSNPCVHGCTAHKVEEYVPPDSIQGKRVGFIHFHMNGGVWPKIPFSTVLQVRTLADQKEAW